MYMRPNAFRKACAGRRSGPEAGGGLRECRGAGRRAGTLRERRFSCREPMEPEASAWKSSTSTDFTDSSPYSRPR